MFLLHRIARWSRVVLGAAKVQLRLSRNNIEDLRPLFGMPLVALVSMAVLVHSGHPELAPYGLVAAMLMTIGQMGLFVASEVVFQERNGQTLELTVASPASYVVILSVRVLMLTLLGLVGVAESWIIARLAFRLALTIYHPSLMFITLVATSLASAGTAVLTAALFSLGRQVRTFQNAVNGPLYLLGGVLVPVTFLPGWMQTVSPFVFFYWSARLLRGAFSPAGETAPYQGILAILALGAASWLIGRFVLARMLNQLRREGALGLT